jgi:NAD(P)-dependent dehydrogenase (short-subunit alcohol dehydrogenase family)
MIDLKGHSALVTGSTKGVGRAIALSFAEAGANVIVHGREEGEESRAVLGECRKFGVRAEFIAADLLGEPAEVLPALCDRAMELLGNVDVLVNNAGQFFDVAFEQMTAERFARTMRLNVETPYFLTQCFARKWIEAKTPGRVLMIGSINGRLAEQGSTAYDVSKGALEMMVRTLAVALAPHKIRVNGLAPGLVRTPQTSWIEANEAKRKWMEYHIPAGVIPGAQVCGPGAVFLCSDAAEYISGHMLSVDGAMSAWQQPRPPK